MTLYQIQELPKVLLQINRHAQNSSRCTPMPELALLLASVHLILGPWCSESFEVWML